MFALLGRKRLGVIRKVNLRTWRKDMKSRNHQKTSKAQSLFTTLKLLLGFSSTPTKLGSPIISSVLELAVLFIPTDAPYGIGGAGPHPLFPGVLPVWLPALRLL